MGLQDVPEVTIHGVRAHERRAVARTFVDRRGLADERAQLGLLQEQGVRVVRLGWGGNIQPPDTPGDVRGGGILSVGSPVVARHRVLIIVEIQGPGERELFVVAKTPDFVGLFPGAAQGRQEHGCQDGNDGDDHQEFNQGEGTLLWRSGLCAAKRRKGTGVWVHGRVSMGRMGPMGRMDDDWAGVQGNLRRR